MDASTGLAGSCARAIGGEPRLFSARPCEYLYREGEGSSRKSPLFACLLAVNGQEFFFY